MPQIEIDNFTNDYSRSNKSEWVVPNSLMVNIEEVVDPELGIMANAKNYTYYPYGNTWAKTLGMSSGNAPSKHCQERWAKLDIFEVYIPLASK
jgi:ribosomal protein S12 methylthiotransferase accessory factor YcaO